MRCKRPICTIGILVILIFGAGMVWGAENIDPNNDGSQYAYGENVGWFNFEPNQGPGVTVSDSNVSGYVWAENIGWINLDPNDSDPDTGIINDGTGQLSGLAWGENVGWINFDPNVPASSTHYGVTIDSSGDFDGWAWGENIGWIHFQSASPVSYKVNTSWLTSCLVDFDDLGEFCGLWLEAGSDVAADFDDSGRVNLFDYTTVVEYWLDYCPPGWQLGGD